MSLGEEICICICIWLFWLPPLYVVKYSPFLSAASVWCCLGTTMTSNNSLLSFIACISVCYCILPQTHQQVAVDKGVICSLLCCYLLVHDYFDSAFYCIPLHSVACQWDDLFHQYFARMMFIPFMLGYKKEKSFKLFSFLVISPHIFLSMYAIWPHLCTFLLHYCTYVPHVHCTST